MSISLKISSRVLSLADAAAPGAGRDITLHAYFSPVVRWVTSFTTEKPAGGPGGTRVSMVLSQYMLKPHHTVQLKVRRGKEVRQGVEARLAASVW